MKTRIPVSIFREYDIRGIAGTELNSHFAFLLGQAYAQLIQGRTPAHGRKNLTVAVGKDCRVSSDEYAAALVEGLMSSGIDVVRLGTCPTPLTYFSIFESDLDGGIMVTGSHNSSDYNGFKLCVGKESIYGEKIQELRGLMEKIALERESKTASQGGVRGQTTDDVIIPKYQSYLIQGARKLKNKKIVIDAGNGTASTVAPELFTRLGAQVVPLYCEMDGRFPNHHPDPTVTENLNDLIALVRKTNADFGIAFDGDADRIGLVDETGRIIFGDELMVLFSRSLLRERPGATIISEVKSSHRLYNDIASHGGNPVMWKTGHSLIKSKMKETGAALAGEMSGHIFFADRYFGYDDAIYAALRVYEIASAAQGPLSSLLADLPSTVVTPEIRVECRDETKFQLVEETKKRLSQTYPINTIDGVRVDFGDSWGLVRASNTQPALVLRFEAPSAARLKEIRHVIETILSEAAVVIGHLPLKV